MIPGEHTQGRRNWGAGGAAASLAFCWEGQGGPFRYKEYHITVSFQEAFS